MTPLVAKMAAQHGVNLSMLQGTGVGGRICKSDVLAAAGIAPTVDDAVRVDVADLRRALNRGGHAVGQRRGGAYALNPAADKIRAEAALDRAAPQPRTSPPTLFLAGDLPPWTASGIPPEALLDVPALARHSMAAVATAAEALAIRDQCSGPDAEETARIFYAQHPSNLDYQDRINQWRVESMSDAQLASSSLPGAADERGRREYARFR